MTGKEFGMNFIHWKKHTEKHWRMGILVLLVSLTAGCAYSGKNTKNILLEEEVYYYIPAGVSFVAEIDGTLMGVTRDKPSWVVDSGYLAKLQEEANRKVFSK